MKIGSAVFKSSVARTTPFDNSLNGFVSTEVQGAIEEAFSTSSNASRGPTTCGFDGNANVGRYLEFSQNNPSNNNPFIIAEPAQLAAVSVSAASNSTGTITIYKNGSALQTISLAAAQKARVKNLTHAFTDLDAISAKVTSGSIDRPTLFMFIRTLP